MSNTEPMPRQPHYNRPPGGPAPQGGPPEYGPDYGPSGPSRRQRRERDGSGSQRMALIIHTVADIAAVILGLWIMLYLLDANQANPFVDFVRDTAEWLGWWAQDIFTMENEGVRVFLNFGLPALIYLLIGHGISARVRRL